MSKDRQRKRAAERRRREEWLGEWQPVTVVVHGDGLCPVCELVGLGVYHRDPADTATVGRSCEKAEGPELLTPDLPRSTPLKRPGADQ